MDCSLWTPWECIYLVIIIFHSAPLSSVCLYKSTYGRKKITPAPLCFPYIHCQDSQVVLCAPVHPESIVWGGNGGISPSTFPPSGSQSSCLLSNFSFSFRKEKCFLNIRNGTDKDYVLTMSESVSWQATLNVGKASRAGNWSTQSWGNLNPAAGFFLFVCWWFFCLLVFVMFFSYVWKSRLFEVRLQFLLWHRI